jgi:hypothetical protein
MREIRLPENAAWSFMDVRAWYAVSILRKLLASMRPASSMYTIWCHYPILGSLMRLIRFGTCDLFAQIAMLQFTWAVSSEASMK